MRFYIVDDDQGVRLMLSDLIEDEALGEVVGEAEDGSLVDPEVLNLKKVDILLIDLLMPVRDGIQTVREIAPHFKGKIIMISQIETKDMIGEAYSLGIEYYIAKPINRLEVLSVIRRVEERVRLQKSIHAIQQTLQVLDFGKSPGPQLKPSSEQNIVTAGRTLLSELGMLGESGSKDLLNMLELLYQYDMESAAPHSFPALKDLFRSLAIRRLGPAAAETDIGKEVKASEQRVRRAILQTLNHVASLGLTDYSNPKFENYASRYFDFTEVRKKMLELQNAAEPSPLPTRINTKKFVQVLYLEAKRLMH
ncbi:DNA-binding domain-containing protein [Paenibacillus rigui]|uniref:Transcriptional regulator n=1 Tax=Paenibacillus rigui TaxID=554312 RepID=A0A229UG38_9BACL|nr:DNA-binding domain-containing protein [Paenibacillus rigui]OXM82332.1 transcriptional regulator [Paenibacillus rigui]